MAGQNKQIKKLQKRISQLEKRDGVAVEKGTKGVISGNFRVGVERRLNNLQTKFSA